MESIIRPTNTEDGSAPKNNYANWKMVCGSALSDCSCTGCSCISYVRLYSEKNGALMLFGYLQLLSIVLQYGIAHISSRIKRCYLYTVRRMIEWVGFIVPLDNNGSFFAVGSFYVIDCPGTDSQTRSQQPGKIHSTHTPKCKPKPKPTSIGPMREITMRLGTLWYAIRHRRIFSLIFQTISPLCCLLEGTGGPIAR